MPVDDPRVDNVRRLAVEVLAPGAERVDVEGVPRDYVSALGEAGALALHAPEEYGGGASAAVIREVAETIAAADASTWFVWTQHASPVRMLSATSNTALRDEWLPRLCHNSLAAVAFSHLRRRNAQVAATRVADGWRLDGSVSWLTSWGLADVVLVSADAGSDGYVHVLLEARDQPGLSVTSPLPLAAMGGTGTVAARFDELVVDESRLVAVSDPQEWHARDDETTADVSPAVFGVTRGALAAIDEPELEAALSSLRSAAYAAADAGAPRQDRVRLRAQALELCLRATAAAVASVGGRAMGLDHPAQRRAREAMFLLVQAQTADLRAATLARLRD